MLLLFENAEDAHANLQASQVMQACIFRACMCSERLHLLWLLFIVPLPFGSCKHGAADVGAEAGQGAEAAL